MYLITAFIQSFWRGQHTIGQPQFPASFGMLPRELVLGIAKHLDLESLSHLSQTCKGLHGLLDPEITKLAPGLLFRGEGRIQQVLSTKMTKSMEWT